MMKEQTLELYVHIPFCKKKCRYCDFLSFAGEEWTQETYTQALIREIGAWRGKENKKVSSVFVGGGTPSILSVRRMEEIFEALRESFFLAENAEITIECNPGTLEKEKLEVYKCLGVNRLSLGLQSAKNEELRLLGRIHTWETFLESFQMARKAGFENLNVDLISALPGQTVESWRETLEKTIALSPEHISAYSLIIEEGTPFYQEYEEDAKIREAGGDPQFLPSEDAERQMYKDTEKILENAGYSRYEISNYAKPGMACQHNMGYWQRKEYIGLGLGASSLYREGRWRNSENLLEYCNREQDMPERKDLQKLSRKDQMEETMFLGLRLMEGVEEEAFFREFGCTCREVYGEVLDRLEDQGLLKEENGRIFLTSHGIDISNYCMAEFLL